MPVAAGKLVHLDGLQKVGHVAFAARRCRCMFICMPWRDQACFQYHLSSMSHSDVVTLRVLHGSHKGWEWHTLLLCGNVHAYQVWAMADKMHASPFMPVGTLHTPLNATQNNRKAYLIYAFESDAKISSMLYSKGERKSSFSSLPFQCSILWRTR